LCHEYLFRKQDDNENYHTCYGDGTKNIPHCSAHSVPKGELARKTVQIKENIIIDLFIYILELENKVDHMFARRDVIYTNWCILWTLVILSLVLFIVLLIDLPHSTLEEQFKGGVKPIQNWVFDALAAAFFFFGLVYTFLHWFYNLGETEDEKTNIIHSNMKWNLITFFISSLLYFVFSLADDIGLIYIFATAFSIQLCCSSPLVLLSLISE
jgi:hypothetical protein